jgi:hypothetical protein
MSDCGVCIGGYDCDGYPEFFNTTWPKARKEHVCEDCNRKILAGQTYHRVSGKYDGEMFDVVTCAICEEIRSAFTCAEYDQTGPPSGELWADIQEQMFPSITTACFDKLRSPEAKAYLRQRWMEWKGLATA